MPKTKTLTVTNTTPVAIVAASAASVIVVGEDPSVVGWPTTDFLVMKPTGTDNARRIPMGNEYRFTCTNGFFNVGQTIGYVQTVAGSTTFYQDESS